VKYLIFLGFLLLAILSVRGMRWAYLTFVVMGLLYFPVSVGFRLHPQPCELLPSLPLAIYSLGNYAHILLFVLFFIMTSAQFPRSRWAGFAWAAAASLAMGILIEIAEGVAGNHHCRLRDLIPDSAGILLGALIVFVWDRLRTEPQTAWPQPTNRA